jgi:hypothetical protein
VVVSKSSDEMAKHANTFDFILNTVGASHDLDQFTALLKRNGTMTLVGLPEHAHPSPSIANLVFKRRSLAGSLIGGIAETQEMLDFCGDHGITSDIELISMTDIDNAYERMLKNDVKYRFVIDIVPSQRSALDVLVAAVGLPEAVHEGRCRRSEIGRVAPHRLGRTSTFPHILDGPKNRLFPLISVELCLINIQGSVGASRRFHWPWPAVSEALFAELR